MVDLSATPNTLAWLSGEKDKATNGTAYALSQNEVNPDEEAETRQIGQQLNIPPIVVRSEPEFYKTQVERQQTATLLERAPNTAAWLAGEGNANIAKDDVGPLSTIEGFFKGIGRGAVRYPAGLYNEQAFVVAGRIGDVGRTFDEIYAEEYSALKESNPYQFDFMRRQAATAEAQRRVTAAQNASVDELAATGAGALATADKLVALAEQVFPRQEAGGRVIERMEAADNTVIDQLGAIFESPVDAVSFLAETAGESIPILAIAALTARTGKTKWDKVFRGSVASGVGSGTTDSGLSALEFLQENGADLSTPEGALAAIQDPELMAKAQEFGHSRGVIIGLFDAMSGGVAGQTLMKNPLGDLAMQTIAQVLFGAGGEATAQQVTTGEIQWGEVVVEGLAEIATTPIEMVGIGQQRVTEYLARFSKADETKAQLDTIDEGVAESKLRERSPEAFRDFLDKTGAAEQVMYVPADELTRYFQGAGQSPEAWEIDSGYLEEMAASGNDIAIPMDVYASQISGTDSAQWVKENARFNPEDMSAAEAASFEQSIKDDIERELSIDRTNTEIEQRTRTSSQQIHDDIYAKLREAGRTVDTAKNEALAVSSFLTTMAERYGVDPASIASTYGLDIRSQESVQRQRTQLDADLNTLRKGRKETRRSLSDFIREQGGIRDEGGDYAALDAKGIVGQTREQITEQGRQPTFDGIPQILKGTTPDEMFRKAVDAGYFAELAGKIDNADYADAIDAAATLFEAVQRDVSGDRVYAEADDGLSALEAEISRLGLDINQSNDEIIAAMEANTYNQDGTLKTDTPEFKAWFGDSQVVDADGNPLVVYHGTNTDFESFSRDSESSSGVATPAMFFTESESIASGFGNKNMPVYLSIKDGVTLDFGGKATILFDGKVMSPSDVVTRISEVNDDLGNRYSLDEDLANELADMGWDEYSGLDTIDGVILQNVDDSMDAFGGEISTHYAVFDPTQIKSVYNKGTFDANDPRILHQNKTTDVASVIAELAKVDDLFQNPVATSTDIKEVFAEVDPAIEFVEESQPDNDGGDIQADTVYVFDSQDSEFAVIENKGEVWINVSRMAPGSGGSSIYQAVADYAFNTNRVFIGDPAGLTPVALRRRTEAMLSSALKHGTTKHLAPHEYQLTGDEAEGVNPLEWNAGDDYGNIQSLIEASISNFIDSAPEFADARYDFTSGTFFDGQGQPITDAALAEWADVQGRGGAPRLGRATVKRAILLNTIAHETGEGRSRLLEQIVSEPRQLLSLQNTFYQRSASDRIKSEKTDAFRKWAGTDSAVIYPDEVNDTDFNGSGPWVMRAFHGTTHEFDIFDASINGSKEGQFGAVNYFTTNKTDATENYGATGTDLTNRIERRAEELQDKMIEQFEEHGRKSVAESLYRSYGELRFISDQVAKMDDDDAAMEFARIIAKQENVGQKESVLSVYIRTENPFVVGGDDSPFIEFSDLEGIEAEAIERVADDEGITAEEVIAMRDDFEDQIDEARWEIEADTESKLYEVVQDVALKYDIDAASLLSDLSEVALEGTDHNTLEQMMRKSEALLYAEDADSGGLIGYHVLGEIVAGLGFDSIVLKNADNRFPGMGLEPGDAHIHVFDQNNTNIKSVENVGTFDISNPSILHQSPDGRDPRGSITFSPEGVAGGQTVIDLFESANLSTFLHESGHFFLEVFSDLAGKDGAPQGMSDDLKAIRDWMGLEDGQAIERKHHEQWARGFEAYVMEGKAPSLALADAFSRFKAWLTRIYKSVRGLDVKITPEIRGVFDRMLATDAQIAEARATQRMSPLFAEKSVAGMDQQAWDAYQRLAKRSEETAQQKLLESTMETVRRETEKWWKAELSEVKAQVTETVNSSPQYRLIEMMANQNWFGEREGEIPDIRLDRKELVETYGEGILAELSRSRLGGKRAIYETGGMSLAEAAEFFGFKDQTKMMTALQNSTKRVDAINAEAEQIMLSRHGDPFTDGSIEEQALDAIHSQAQAHTVATEAMYLAKQAGRDTRGINARVMRARAKSMIGRMSVRDATKPDSFLASERRSAKEAEKAFARVVSGRNKKEAFTAASMHKERQLLNHYLYLESRDLKKLVDSRREKMRNYAKKSVREKLEGGYIEQIDGILSDFDFRIRGIKQIKRAESLKAFVDRMVEDGREAELAIDERLLDESSRTHYTKLSVDEILGLFDTIENLDHMGRFKQTLINAKAARDLNEAAESIATNISKNLPKREPKRNPTVGDNLNDIGRSYLSIGLSAETLLREVDGFEDLGEAYAILKSGIDAANSNAQIMSVKAAEDIEKLYSAYTKKERREMQTQKSMAGRTMSKWEAIAVALNTGNDDNLNRLLDPRANDDARLTQEQLDEVLDTLDQRDWQLVQDTWKLIDEYWPLIAEREKRATGVVPKKVEGRIIQTKFGEIKGGYYPIKYHRKLSLAVSNDVRNEAFEKFSGGRFLKAQTKNGHTKERTNSGGGRTLSWDIGIVTTHINDVIHDLNMSEPVNNAARVLSHPAVRGAFVNAGRSSDLEALELWVQDVAAGPQAAMDAVSMAMRGFKNNFTLAKLGLNFSTMLVQVTGLGQSAVVIGKKNMAQGFSDYIKNPEKWKKEITAKSPLMAERETTFQKDTRDMMNDISTRGPIQSQQKAVRETMGKIGFLGMTKTQFYGVDLPTWLGAYRSGLEKFNNSEAKAIEYADRMVERSQGSGMLSSRTAFERGTLNHNTRQSNLVRIFATLGGYFFAKFNVAYEVGKKASRDIKAAETAQRKAVLALNAAVDFSLLFTLEAVAYAFLKGDLPDEPEDYPAWMAKESALSFAGGLPFLRDMAGPLQGYGAGGAYGSMGDMIGRAVIQALQGENDPAARRSAADVIGVATGLPTTFSLRIIEGVINAKNGEDVSLIEFAMGAKK